MNHSAKCPKHEESHWYASVVTTELPHSLKTLRNTAMKCTPSQPLFDYDDDVEPLKIKPLRSASAAIVLGLLHKKATPTEQNSADAET